MPIIKSCQNCEVEKGDLFESKAKLFQHRAKKVVGSIQICNKCRYFFEKRAEKLNEVIESGNEKRLIVAGPGTGKTYTFKEVVKELAAPKKILIFTFINNLVNDLREEFSDAEFESVKVVTLHAYCKDLLYNELGCRDTYYPHVSLLIEDDAQKLKMKFKQQNFNQSFANLDENSPALKFYLQRSSYYEAVEHIHSVYKVYHHYLKESPVSTYDLVIVDEYQDFNELESSFINILAKTNPILVAGDDDQAVYGFRYASNIHIRKLYKDVNFDKFNLPFSSRCTQILVESVNHLIKMVISNNKLLDGRIDAKEFSSYYPDKYVLDAKYPKIQVANCSSPSTAELYIKDQIENISSDEGLTGEEGDIQFLVIGAESQHRLNSLATYLKENLDESLYEIEVKEEKGSITIEDGFLFISKNQKSNLGWRIILYLDPPQNISNIIKLTYQNESSIYDLLSKKYVDKYLLKIEEHFSQNNSEPEDEKPEELVTKKIRIKLTNCLGSKGLSALHVMALEFHNGVIPSDETGQNITDEDVYRCIVTLTRAKRSCSLITFKKFDRNLGKSVVKPSKFIEMLPRENLNEINYRVKNGKLIQLN